MSIFARGWAAGRGDSLGIHEFLSGWWVCSKQGSAGHPTFCAMQGDFFFFQLFSSNYFPLKHLYSELDAFLWMLFSSCPPCIFYMTMSSKNWCNKFVHSAVPKFSSICGRSSKGQMHLSSIVTVAWNGNCNAWKISCWFIFISADENYYDVSSRA